MRGGLKMGQIYVEHFHSEHLSTIQHDLKTFLFKHPEAEIIQIVSSRDERNMEGSLVVYHGMLLVAEVPDENLVREEQATCIRGKAHRFEPRYDYTYPEKEDAFFQRLDQMGGPIVHLCELLKAAKETRYVRDICVRCGETRERETEPVDHHPLPVYPEDRRQR
jgi:hypothetical protein